VRDSGRVFATCRNVLFMEPSDATHSGARPAPAGEGLALPPAAPPE
jgi:hypothetical protein